MKTLTYDKPQTWINTLNKIFEDLLSQDDIDILTDEEIDFDFLKDYIEDNICYDGDFYSDVLNEIVKRFDYITAYHGCRPLSIEDYTSNGIVVLDNDYYSKVIATKFKSIGITENRVKEILKNIGKEDDYQFRVSSYTHFELIYDCLLNQSPQYLLYGGELLISIFNEISREELECNTLTFLQKYGTPTVITCKIDINRLCKNDLAFLVDQCIRIFLHNKIFGNYKAAKRASFPIKIDGNVSGSDIIDIDHPSISKIKQVP